MEKIPKLWAIVDDTCAALLSNGLYGSPIYRSKEEAEARIVEFNQLWPDNTNSWRVMRIGFYHE